MICGGKWGGCKETLYVVSMVLTAVCAIAFFSLYFSGVSSYDPKSKFGWNMLFVGLLLGEYLAPTVEWICLWFIALDVWNLNDMSDCSFENEIQWRYEPYSGTTFEP